MPPIVASHGVPALCLRSANRAIPARNLRPAILSMLLAATLASPAALADEMAGAVDATELDTVVVTGERLPGYESGSTSGATRLELSARETPQSISVVTRTQMDDFGLYSINDVLGSTTGINVEQVESDRTYYTARGFDIINFQRDGLGLPLPYGIQNGDIDTAVYERIEVLRGANGLMSSTGNPSATINFVRKRPGPGFEGSARLTEGSWNSLRIIGWALLGAGFAWFVGGEGWELGAIFWSAALMLSAIAWVLSMALAPRRSLAMPMLVSTAAAASWLVGVG